MTDHGFSLFKPTYLDALVSHMHAQLRRALTQAWPALAQCGVSLVEQARAMTVLRQAQEQFLSLFRQWLQDQRCDLTTLALQDSEQWLLQALLQREPEYQSLHASYCSELVLPGDSAEQALLPALQAPVLLRMWLLSCAGLPLSLQIKAVLSTAWLRQLACVQSDIGGLLQAWLHRAGAQPFADQQALQCQWQEDIDVLQRPFPSQALVDWQQFDVLSLADAGQQPLLQRLCSALSEDAVQTSDNARAFVAQTALQYLQTHSFCLLLPLHQQTVLMALAPELSSPRDVWSWLPLLDYLAGTAALLTSRVEALACSASVSEELGQMRAAISEILHERLGGVAWPPVICDLVDQYWLPMLMDIDWHWGRASSQWLTALTVLDELLLMLEPNLPLAERLEQAALLPDLLHRLRSLLVADSSVDLVRRRESRQQFSALLERLGEVHLLLLGQGQWAEGRVWQSTTAAPVTPVAAALWWQHPQYGTARCLYRDTHHCVLLILQSGTMQLLSQSQLHQAAWTVV